MKEFFKKNWFYMLLLIFAILIPFTDPGRLTYSMLIVGGIFAIATLSLNLIVGFTGQANLAHGAFFGIGAYTVGILTKAGASFWIALPLAALLCAFVGFLIGFPTLRTKGTYFAISTLSFGMVVYIVAQNWVNLTGGNIGMPGVPRPTPIPLPFGGELAFTTPMARYYLVLFFVLLTLLVMHRVVYSLQGFSFLAIMNNEMLAESAGINTFRNKLLSMVISTFFVGIAGGLYAAQLQALYPGVARYDLTFYFIIFLLLGGVATLAGPIIGALGVWYLLEKLHPLGHWQMVIFGALLVLVIIYFPRGLMGGLTNLWNWLKVPDRLNKLWRNLKKYYRQRKDGAKNAASS